MKAFTNTNKNTLKIKLLQKGNIMKNIIKNKINALALIAVAAMFTGLLSCSDTSNPLGSVNQNNNSGLVSSNSTDNTDNNITDEYAIKGPEHGPGHDNKGTNIKKRALPLPCLNLSTEQLTSLKTLRHDTETKNSQLRKDFETQVKALRDAAIAASSGTVTISINKDSINAIITDLQAKEKAINDQLRDKESQLKAQLDAIKANYKDQLTAAGSDRAARKAIEDKMRTEMKTAQDAFQTDTKSLKDQQRTIHSQIEQVRHSLGELEHKKEHGPILDATTKAALDAQVKILADALKLALDANEKAFLDAFRNGLTAEQQVIFDAWVAGTDCNHTTKKVVK